MIPEPVQGWLDTLLGVHDADMRVALYTGAPRTFVGYLQVSRCSLRLDGRSDVLRSADLVAAVEAESSPSRAGVEALTVAGGEIEVDFGVRVRGDWHYATLATLRIDSVDVNTLRNEVRITAFDRSTLIQEFPLILPWSTRENETFAETVGFLIADADIFDPVYVLAGVDTATEPRVGTQYTGDRLRAVHDAAAAVSARFYADNLGRYVLAPQPEPNPATYVWEVAAGPGGALITLGQSYSRREQYNAVALSVEPADGDQIFVFLVDADPDSPTFWLGPFGRKVFEERTDALLTEQQAIDKAASLLDLYNGSTRALEMTTVYNPLLEPGDSIRTTFLSSEPEVHIIDQLEFSFPNPSMSVVTRLERDRIYAPPPARAGRAALTARLVSGDPPPVPAREDNRR